MIPPWALLLNSLTTPRLLPPTTADKRGASAEESLKAANQIRSLLDYHDALTVFEKDAHRRVGFWAATLLRAWINQAHTVDPDQELTIDLKSGRTLNVRGLPADIGSRLPGLLAKQDIKPLLLLHVCCLPIGCRR